MVQCSRQRLGGRFTVSSMIDWAPRMPTMDVFTNRSTFGFGIWKSAYLLPVQHAAITQFVPHTFYNGGHPTELLADGGHAGFRVIARVDIYSPGGGGGQLTVLGSWPGAVAVTQPVQLERGENNCTLEIPAAQTRGARLWQPNGHGAQTRYTVTATFAPAGGAAAAAVTTSRTIGFRHVALITVNDTDAATAAAAATADGTGQFTMFFRVNGAAVYARGGNKIVSGPPSIGRACLQYSAPAFFHFADQPF